MKTYISILRGINVSGKKLIKMDVLKNLYQSLGFYEVKTYVQSGNVVFAAEELESKTLATKISQQIALAFGFDVPVIVIGIDELNNIISNNPFLQDLQKDPAFLHVTFVSTPPEKYDTKAIEDKEQEGEKIFFTDIAIYLYCPNGYGRTKLTNNFLEDKLKVPLTTRNWKTTNELLKIANQIQLTL